MWRSLEGNGVTKVSVRSNHHSPVALEVTVNACAGG